MLKVSVVVTAYNRKEFLNEALNSLINQTLDKQYFEVILLTNFDYDVSPYGVLNICHFKLNGTVGEYMYKALKEAKGEIVCFLDDDDLYVQDKLFILCNNFSESTIYFKHNVMPFRSISDLGKEIESRRSKFKHIQLRDSKHPNLYAYNRTSIALRKSFISEYAEAIRKLDVSEDWFFFLSFISSNGTGIYDTDGLSYYRKHDSVSSKAVTKSDKNFESYVNYLVRLIDSFEYMRGVFNNPFAQKILKYQLSVFNVRLLLLTGKDNSAWRKSDLVDLLEASAYNYNEFWLIKALFLRAFIRYYFPSLSETVERLYVRASRAINANIT